MCTSGHHAILALFCAASILAADPVTPAPPLPSELPVLAPASPNVNVPLRRPTIQPLQQRRATPSVAAPGARAAFTNNAARVYQTSQVGDHVLAWDSILKEYQAVPGDVTAPFKFSVKNVSKTNVVINRVLPSCGCTAAKVPPLPWTLTPGESGEMEFSLDLRGKFGVLTKHVTVDTSAGQRILSIKCTIPGAGVAASSGGAPLDERARNMQLAAADRQIVFRGDCAKCHATPTVGKMGEELYLSACGICHDAPHRATMVPDLRALRNATGKEYWHHWITHGKAGSLMPAFAKANGGPLTEEQIRSLTDFLDVHFPKAIVTTPVAGAGSGN